MGILDKFRKEEVSYYTADTETLKKIVRKRWTKLDCRVHALARLIELKEVQPNVDSIVEEIGISRKDAEKILNRFTYLTTLGKARLLRMQGKYDLADQMERELELNNKN